MLSNQLIREKKTISRWLHRNLLRRKLILELVSFFFQVSYTIFETQFKDLTKETMHSNENLCDSYRQKANKVGIIFFFNFSFSRWEYFFYQFLDIYFVVGPSNGDFFESQFHQWSWKSRRFFQNVEQVQLIETVKNKEWRDLRKVIIDSKVLWRAQIFFL